MNFLWQLVECKGTRPLGRSSHSLDVIDKTVYVMGGENQPRVPIGSDVWCLDVTSGTWRQLETEGDVVPPRNAHASAVVGSSIYMFGGRQGIAMGEGSLSDMYRLDTATAGKAKWTKVSMKGDVPEARSYHAMTAVGTTLYVFGGCTTEGRLNDLHSFDTNTGVWQKMPKSDDILGRGGAGLVSIGARLYVVGGFAGKEMGDVHEFDTDGREWRQLAQPLPPRSVFGVVALDKRIVVIGGEVDPSSEGHAGAGHFSQDVYVLDTADEEGGWVKATVAGEAEAQWSARGWFPAAAYGDNTIAVFGGNALDNSRLDDCFLLCMDKQLKH